MVTWRAAVRPGALSVGVAVALSLVATPAQADCIDVIRSQGRLRDLAPTVSGPFDHARATGVIRSQRGRSVVTFRVRGIDRSARGETYGAHLHLGPCVAGEPAAALGHYNTDVIEGRTPVRVNDRTEVWLDFTVQRKGKARSDAWVPFVPQPGTRSIVIHAMPTDPSGAAGSRLACLPMEWA